MRVSDLAREIGTTSEAILAKLKSLHLRAKDSAQELNEAVIPVLRRELKGGSQEKAVKEPPQTKVSAGAEKEIRKSAEKVKETAKPKTKKRAAIPPARRSGEKVKTKKKVVAEKFKKPQKPKPAGKKIQTLKASSHVTPQVVAPESSPQVKTTHTQTMPAIEKKRTSGAGVIEKPVISKTIPSAVTFVAPTQAPSAPRVSVPSAPRVSVPSAPVKVEKRLPAPATVLSGDKLTIEPKKATETLEVQLPIAVKDLAVRFGQKPSVILKQLMQRGIFAHINQNLDKKVVQTLAGDFGFSLVEPKTKEEQLIASHKTEEEDKSFLKPRSPVVTFMGHVDHGKTSLLDKIRKTKVADREHGGITQHIGAYSVNLPKGKITFLDTPGHEAFTAMRARGAHITDLVVLVVAADEGVMPQTEEAIDHAKAAGVPIVVALNKIDKKNADIDGVKKQLSDHGLVPEDWGGKTIVTGVSATTGEGIDHLLEMVLLEAELLELKANYDKKATGIVVEAQLSRGKGPVATVIVQNGTLHEGDMIVVGPHYGRIKAMFDDRQNVITAAGPAAAAEILGLSGVPDAGEIFYVVEDEKHAKEIGGERSQQIKNEKMQPTPKISLEDLYAQIKEGKIKELNIILKADVQGSLEALKDSLTKIATSEVQLKFIHTGVGEINASDVILAEASRAIIIGFHMEIGQRAKEEMEKRQVDVRTYRIIYDAINDVKNALSGLLEPKIKKKFLGRVEIRQVFNLSKSGIVAGCFVLKGKIHRKVNVDLIRNGGVVFSGALSSLKRFKDDVREVAEGFECGLTINGYNDIQPGDVVEAFELEKIARTL